MKYCFYCGSKRIFSLYSLKHYWIYCLSCKNLKNVPKNKKNFFNYISWILLIIDKIFRVKLINTLCYFNRSPSKSYYYYKEIIKNSEYKNTKWFSYDNDFINFLKKNHIDIKEKKICSISEEPGFFYYKIKDQCTDVVFTALNQSVAKEMKKIIGVNTLTYDGNKDDISKLTSKKFDIVLFRLVLNHIENLRKFITQIKKITHKNTIIICSFHTPSIQTSIIFGYDDYTFSGLYDEKFVENEFLKQKFKIKKKFTLTEDLVKKYYSNSFKKILLFKPMYIFFKLQNYYKNTNFSEILKYKNYEKKVTFILTKF
jgi:2-polyprenyl-3-methyl-5-hydroxy-6-metoxy-1,4-benzoquinol methylase